jgi:hypothetical protein
MIKLIQFQPEPAAAPPPPPPSGHAKPTKPAKHRVPPHPSQLTNDARQVLLGLLGCDRSDEFGMTYLTPRGFDPNIPVPMEIDSPVSAPEQAEVDDEDTAPDRHTAAPDPSTSPSSSLTSVSSLLPQRPPEFMRNLLIAISNCTSTIGLSDSSCQLYAFISSSSFLSFAQSWFRYHCCPSCPQSFLVPASLISASGSSGRL